RIPAGAAHGGRRSGKARAGADPGAAGRAGAMSYTRIAGTGSYLPARVLSNAELETLVDTTDEWIRTRTGIERRHIAADDETTADLAVHAARRAMEAAGVAPG